ncbi:hypothetical protein SLITO_v1c04600 [Spiroplasma litorale]|uniref:Uncharacterized protein n=1 Tax=Spiroplasma litorale TaxID=216942 RepID=A0A0K1W1R0_9MOLU|nr:hypothetical protein [Spiroplasma litorale]AKX34113.1 hypothetical protein SLITO_v1c04600 [Spiroplasma litorale]
MKKVWIVMLITSIALLIISTLSLTLPDFKYKNQLLYEYYSGIKFPSKLENIQIWIKLMLSMSVISSVISIFVLVMGYFYENTTYNKYAAMTQIPVVFIAFFSGLMMLIAGCMTLSGGTINSSSKTSLIILQVFINLGYVSLTGITIWTCIVEYKANSLK